MPTTPLTRRPQPRTHHPTAAHLPPSLLSTNASLSAHLHPNFSALVPSLLSPNASLSAHLQPNFSALSYSFTPVFANFSPKEPSHAYTPSSTKPRTNSSNSAHLHQAAYVRSRSFLLRSQSGSAMGTERLSHTNKSLLPCCPSAVRWGRSGSPIRSNRWFQNVRAVVRRYRRKVYRVFPENL